MTDANVNLLDGNTFVVSDNRGDIEATPTDAAGLFSFDTRFLSRWVLSVDDTRLSALSVDDLQYYETAFFCVPGTTAVYVDAQLSVRRRRKVCDGFREGILLVNHKEEPVDLRVRVEAGSDFADLFDVKNNTPKKGIVVKRVEDGALVLGYQREDFRRETVIWADQPAQIDEQGLTFLGHLEPNQQWSIQLQVTPTILRRGPARTVGGGLAGRPGPGRRTAALAIGGADAAVRLGSFDTHLRTRPQ